MFSLFNSLVYTSTTLFIINLILQIYEFYCKWRDENSFFYKFSPTLFSYTETLSTITANILFFHELEHGLVYSEVNAKESKIFIKQKACPSMSNPRHSYFSFIGNITLNPVEKGSEITVTCKIQLFSLLLLSTYFLLALSISISVGYGEPKWGVFPFFLTGFACVLLPLYKFYTEKERFQGNISELIFMLKNVNNNCVSDVMKNTLD